jgi:hypothetical protein
VHRGTIPRRGARTGSRVHLDGDLWAGDDPLKTISWTMLKELVRRLVAWDVDVEMGDDLQRRMVKSDQFDPRPHKSSRNVPSEHAAGKRLPSQRVR